MSLHELAPRTTLRSCMPPAHAEHLHAAAARARGVATRRAVRSGLVTSRRRSSRALLAVDRRRAVEAPPRNDKSPASSTSRSSMDVGPIGRRQQGSVCRRPAAIALATPLHVARRAGDASARSSGRYRAVNRNPRRTPSVCTKGGRDQASFGAGTGLFPANAAGAEHRARMSAEAINPRSIAGASAPLRESH